MATPDYSDIRSKYACSYQTHPLSTGVWAQEKCKQMPNHSSILSCLIQANILQAYEALEKIAMHYYSTDDQFIISAPTQDQVTPYFSQNNEA